MPASKRVNNDLEVARRNILDAGKVFNFDPASQEIRVTRFAQPTINSLACCICWTRLLGRAVFPHWNEGPNFGSYTN